MRSILVFILFGMVFTFGWSQSTEPLVTDRPGQAIASQTVGNGALQIQTGANVQGERLPAFTTSYLASEFVLRYGLGDRFELNGLFSHQTPVGNQFISTLQGISNCRLGMRIGILEGKGLIPTLAFQYQLKLRTVSDIFRAPTTASQFIFSSSQSLSEKLTLTTNLGMDWDGFGNSPTGLYVLNLSFPLAPKLGAFVENYGSFGNGFETRFDAGAAYLVNPGLQFDFSLGGGRNDEINDYFIGLGISWRILP